MKKVFDVIVVGLGAMGSATAYQLSKMGASVLGIDQFNPPHTLGSSHGDTRITREAIGEGAEYVPLVLRSNEIWREIEEETGSELLHRVGTLIMANDQGQVDRHGVNKFLQTTIDVANTYHISHDVLKTEDIYERFPQFAVTQRERGYFETQAGYLVPELCISSQLELAKKYGAQLNTNEKVLQWMVDTTGNVNVRTDHDEYVAEKLVLTVGPWFKDFFPDEVAQNLGVYRQVLYWFDFNKKDYQLFKDMPVFIWEFGGGYDDFMYGFPAIDGVNGGVKVATESYDSTTDPEKVGREVSKSEVQDMYDKYVRERIPQLKPNCIRAMSCMYTVTPDHNFVIDFHPEHGSVILASPCSGHGFKHSAAIGETLAQMAMHGKSELDITSFSCWRF